MGSCLSAGDFSSLNALVYPVNRIPQANSKKVTVLGSASATRLFSSRNEPPPDRRRSPPTLPENGKGHAAKQAENKNDQQSLQQALKSIRRRQPRTAVTAV